MLTLTTTYNHHAFEFQWARKKQVYRERGWPIKKLKNENRIDLKNSFLFSKYASKWLTNPFQTPS